MHDALPLASTDAERDAHYQLVLASVDALLEGESDFIAAQATIACELHHAFDYYHWTGFYRLTEPETLVIGPYQGGHGCLRIALERGVCGAAARSKTTQLVPDVHAFPDHIACSSSTLSEVVVPIVTDAGDVLGVFDVDSDDPAAFREVDQRHLEVLCHKLAAQFGKKEK